MILLKIVSAYEAAKKLKDTELDFSSAYALVLLIKELEVHALAYAEGERKLIEKYAKKDEHGRAVISSGRKIEFSDSESAEAFAQERNKISAFEVEHSIKPIKIRPPSKISAAVLIALEGFVEFDKGDEK